MPETIQFNIEDDNSELEVNEPTMDLIHVEGTITSNIVVSSDNDNNSETRNIQPMDDQFDGINVRQLLERNNNLDIVVSNETVIIIRDFFRSSVLSVGSNVQPRLMVLDDIPVEDRGSLTGLLVSSINTLANIFRFSASPAARDPLYDSLHELVNARRVELEEILSARIEQRPIVNIVNNIVNDDAGLSEEEIMLCLTPTKYCDKSFEDGETADLCCICLEEYMYGEDVNNLRCNHIFHLGCIKEWLMRNKFCPMCKTNVTAK